MNKKQIKVILAAILVILVFIVLPILLNSVYKSSSQDDFIVNSSEETVYINTGGELSVKKNATCVVREKSHGINSVKIPVPKNSASDIKAESDNIRNISLLNNGTKDYIFIEFSEAYSPSEAFSFSVSYMLTGQYKAEASSGKCSYSYIAGDYSGAYVNSAILYWNAYDAVFSDAGLIDSGKLVWSSCPGRDTFLANVSYSLETFNSQVYMTALSDMARQTILPYYVLIWCLAAALCVSIVILIIIRFRRKKQYISGKGAFPEPEQNTTVINNER